MEILNIGPLELILIIILAVVIFGPEDMVKYSRAAGRWLYKASKSEFWKSVVGTSKEIQEFPRQIMKEAQIEESLKEFKAMSHPTTGVDAEPTILPPVQVSKESAPPETDKKDPGNEG
ncbi:MAG TPA: hypothetical protein DDW19_00835 [Anaerolineaceae bacterium]|jgi:Sec-independent protein translocase protein TatA|nr:hypothetical protein [Anaerolineaceae bacterium]